MENQNFTNDEKKAIIKAFYKTLDTWYYPSDMDCIEGSKLDDFQLRTLRVNFGIGLDETILFKRDTSFWSTNNQGLVITDEGFYAIQDNDNPSSCLLLSWKEFDSVRYKEGTFYFYNKEHMVIYIGYSYFYKNIEAEDISKIGPKLAKALTEIASLAEPDIALGDLVAEEKYDEAIEAANALIQANANNFDAHCYKGAAIYLKETEKENPDEQQLEMALTELQKAYELTDDANQLYGVILGQGRVNAAMGRDYQARNKYVMALDICQKEDKEEVMGAIIRAEGNLKETWDNYTTVYEYKDRKFIMPVKDQDIAGCVVDGIDVFRMSNIPSCFKFPTGHPTANQLYIGHPYNPSLYVPFEDSEDIFFVDKVHELCYLLECLGAEEIAITSIKGRDVSELNDSQRNYSANTDIKMFSGEADMKSQRHYQGEQTSHNQRTMRIKLDPMRAPFLPEGLIWYDEQPQWQRLVNSRINGNMLEYNEFVSTSQTKFISSTEKTNIKASAKYLWMKVNAEVENNIETQFKETTETQWKVEVKFRSLKNFANNASQTQIESNTREQISNHSNLSSAEQEYLEEAKACLADGEIGDSERRILNKVRVKLGISEERAAELEASLQQPQLTEEEKEYLEAYKDAMEDGIITEKERRLLDKMMQINDISEERAKEIEAMY